MLEQKGAHEYRCKPIPQQQSSLKFYQKGDKVEGEPQFTRMQRKLHLIISQEEQELSAPSVSYCGQNISDGRNGSDACRSELKAINGNKPVVDEDPTDRARRKAKTGLKAILDAMEREDEPPEQSISDNPTVILQNYKYKKYARRGAMNKPAHVKQKLSFLIDFFNDHNQVGSVSYYSESQDQNEIENAEEQNNYQQLNEQKMGKAHPINQAGRMQISNQKRLIFDNDQLSEKEQRYDKRQVIYSVKQQRKVKDVQSSPTIPKSQKDKEARNNKQTERIEQIIPTNQSRTQSREQLAKVILNPRKETHSRTSSITPPYEKIESQSNQRTINQKTQSISSQVQPKRGQTVQESVPGYVPTNTASILGKKEAAYAIVQSQNRGQIIKEQVQSYVPQNKTSISRKKDTTYEVNQAPSKVQSFQESVQSYVPTNTASIQGKKEAVQAVNQAPSRVPIQESVLLYVPTNTAQNSGKKKLTFAVNQTSSIIQPAQESVQSYVPTKTASIQKKKEAVHAANQASSRWQPVQESVRSYIPTKKGLIEGKKEANYSVNEAYLLPQKEMFSLEEENVFRQRKLNPSRAYTQHQEDNRGQRRAPPMASNNELHFRENNITFPPEAIHSPSLPTEGFKSPHFKLTRAKDSPSLPFSLTPKSSMNAKKTILYPNSVSRVSRKQVQINRGNPINLYESTVVKLKEITRALQTSLLSPMPLGGEMEDCKNDPIENIFETPDTPQVSSYDPLGRNGIRFAGPIVQSVESDKDNIKPHVLLKLMANGNHSTLVNKGLQKAAYNLRTLASDTYKIATTPIKSLNIKLPQGNQQGFIQLHKVRCDQGDLPSKRMRTEGQFNQGYETEQSEDQYSSYDSINLHRKRKNKDKSYRQIQKKYKAYIPKDSPALLPKISRHLLHRYPELSPQELYERDMTDQRYRASKQISPRMTDSTYRLKVCKLRQLRRIADDLSDYNQQLDQLY